MVAYSTAERLTLPIAPLVAVVLGASAAAAIALMPVAPLESLVMDSGLPAVIALAEPPLGATARALIGGGVGLTVALVGWFLLFLVIGTRGLTLRRGAADEGDVDELVTPVIRRADAHPDAPPRPPLLATRDLGTPFLEVTARHRSAESGLEDAPEAETAAPRFAAVVEETPAEQPLPADLDQPLAAFDPGAIPEVPMPAPVPISPRRPEPRAPVYEAGERFETFELTPPVRAVVEPVPMPITPPPPVVALAPQPLAPRAEPIAPTAEPIAAPETDATIQALLARLEQGVARRGIGQHAPAQAPAPRRSNAEHGLDEALASLRRLALRASA